MYNVMTLRLQNIELCFTFVCVVCCFGSETISAALVNIARQCCPQLEWDWHLRQNQCLYHSGLKGSRAS